MGAVIIQPGRKFELVTCLVFFFFFKDIHSECNREGETVVHMLCNHSELEEEENINVITMVSMRKVSEYNDN